VQLGIKLNVLAALWAENLEGSQQHMALSEVWAAHAGAALMASKGAVCVPQWLSKLYLTYRCFSFLAGWLTGGTACLRGHRILHGPPHSCGVLPG
jgi:hypothetical protein